MLFYSTIRCHNPRGWLVASVLYDEISVMNSFHTSFVLSEEPEIFGHNGWNEEDAAVLRKAEMMT